MSTVESPWRRRVVGQGIALLVLGMIAWTVVTASDSTVMRGDLGSNEGLSGERAALVRLLDGVVAHVEVGSVDEAGRDQSADFGASAGAGPDGAPPAAPGRIGRQAPSLEGDRFGVIEPAPGPFRPQMDEPRPLAMPEQDDELDPGPEVVPAGPTSGNDLGPSAPSTTSVSAPSDSTAPTIRTTTTRRSTTTRRVTTTTASTVPTPPPTSVSPTVTTPTTAEPTLTTAAVTTASTSPPPPANCIVIVSRSRPLRAAPASSAEVIGQSEVGTFTVLERQGRRWYRISAGWLRQSRHVTPERC